MGARNGRFIASACINVVVAANAGGVFSPFGGITTLMVWQKGMVHFGDFFALFIPSLINWLVPAALIPLTGPHGKPSARTEQVQVKYGGYVIVILFLITIAGGAGTGDLYVLCPPEVDMGDCAGLCSKYRRSSRDE